MRIKSIDFGRDTAEFDPISEYFVQTPAYERLLAGDRSIIIGRKGTGKTALLKYCVENENTACQYVIRIEASHATLHRLDEQLHSFTSQVRNLDSGFKVAWLFATLLAVLHRLGSEETVGVRVNEKKLMNLAEREFGYTPSDPISVLAGYAASWFRDLKRIGPVERDIRGEVSRIPFDEVALRDLLKETIGRANAKGKTVFLFYDKLDERWDGSDFYINFLRGLLLAIKDIKSLGLDTRPVVLLRDDIFKRVVEGFQHLDHFRMEIEPIEWDERSLVELIALRIRASLERLGQRLRDASYSDLWDFAFPFDVPARKTPISPAAFIIDRSLARPRDVILLSNLAREVAIKHRHEQMEVEDLREAEVHYSRAAYDHLLNEVNYRFPNLRMVLERFRGQTIGCSREDLLFRLLEAIDELSTDLPWMPQDERDLAALLYEIGFLSYTEKGGSLRGTRVVHSGVQPNALMLLKQERIYVSPMFRQALDMKDH